MSSFPTSELEPSNDRQYGRIAILLVLLALLSVWISTVNFGSVSVNILAALTIATIKATLVALFFMGLREGKAIPAVIFFASMAFIGILFAFTFVDATSRPHVMKPPAAKPAAAFVTR